MIDQLLPNIKPSHSTAKFILRHLKFSLHLVISSPHLTFTARHRLPFSSAMTFFQKLRLDFLQSRLFPLNEEQVLDVTARCLAEKHAVSGIEFIKNYSGFSYSILVYYRCKLYRYGTGCFFGPATKASRRRNLRTVRSKAGDLPIQPKSAHCSSRTFSLP